MLNIPSRIELGFVGVCLALTLSLALGAIPAFAASTAPVLSKPSLIKAPVAPIQTGVWTYAVSAYAPPKYPADFKNFEYVNPTAPKGGTLNLKQPDRRSSFDKFNPFTTRGNAPAAMKIFALETLGIRSMDEPLAMYGLLSESFFVAPDLSSISFRLNPKAHFNNGDPVTAQDVVYSLERLKSKEAGPEIQSEVADLERAVAVDARTVRIDLSAKTVNAVFAAGSLWVFSHKWGEGKKFDEVVTEPPIASGAYVIDTFEMPSRISFKRAPDYWGKDLAVRKGHFNFDNIRYRMYSDDAVAWEAFKAGEFDIFKEYRASAWVRKHTGPKWENGTLIKKAFKTGAGQGLQALNLNLRHPLFQDIRVREALMLAWDFDKYNQYRTFTHSNSVFNNSEFAATGEPSVDELKLLEPFRAELPPRVFGPAFVAPSNLTSPNALREHLRQARDLLAQAGWKVAADGKLRNVKGEAFAFEFLATNQPGTLIDYQRNLAKLGITMTERLVDYALFTRRLEQYDFDLVILVSGDFTLPSAAELASSYGSKSADEPGNNNALGVKSRAADALIARVGAATNLEELRTATRAFDRVAMWSIWQVPQIYVSDEQISYRNRFGMPTTQAKYFSADNHLAFSSPPWPLWTWWNKEPSEAAVRK